MNFKEVMDAARGNMGPYCKVCPVCDGRACKNQMPGPGAKGVGDNAVRNYQKWQEIRVNMDTHPREWSGGYLSGTLWKDIQISVLCRPGRSHDPALRG